MPVVELENVYLTRVKFLYKYFYISCLITDYCICLNIHACQSLRINLSLGKRADFHLKSFVKAYVLYPALVVQIVMMPIQ